MTLHGGLRGLLTLGTKGQGVTNCPQSPYTHRVIMVQVNAGEPRLAAVGYVGPPAHPLHAHLLHFPHPAYLVQDLGNSVVPAQF